MGRDGTPRYRARSRRAGGGGAEEARERARILEIEAGDAESDLEVAKEALAGARRRAKEARSAADEAAAAVQKAAKAAGVEGTGGLPS